MSCNIDLRFLCYVMMVYINFFGFIYFIFKKKNQEKLYIIYKMDGDMGMDIDRFVYEK